MSRRTNMANGLEKEAKQVASEPREQKPDAASAVDMTDNLSAVDKQKRLLEESEVGHFSMIRTLHMADVVTLGNGI